MNKYLIAAGIAALGIYIAYKLHKKKVVAAENLVAEKKIEQVKIDFKAPTIYPLKFGSVGRDVLILQQYLGVQGTGVFDVDTENALKRLTGLVILYKKSELSTVRDMVGVSQKLQIG